MPPLGAPGSQQSIGMDGMYRGDEEDNDDRAFLTGFDRIDAKAAKRHTNEKRKKHLLSASQTLRALRYEPYD